MFIYINLILQLAYNLLKGDSCIQFISICAFPSDINTFETWQVINVELVVL